MSMLTSFSSLLFPLWGKSEECSRMLPEFFNTGLHKNISSYPRKPCVTVMHCREEGWWEAEESILLFSNLDQMEIPAFC